MPCKSGICCHKFSHCLQKSSTSQNICVMSSRDTIVDINFPIASYKPHIFATHAISVELIFPKAMPTAVNYARAGNHRILGISNKLLARKLLFQCFQRSPTVINWSFRTIRSIRTFNSTTYRNTWTIAIA